jgi:hypothetical protein
MARRSYTRHGLHALKARVMVRGLQAIDGRTAAAQHLVAFRRELLDDLGGESAVSAAQLALVEVATRTRLYLDHVDAVLLERESLVVRGRRLLPLVEQRGRLASSLLEVLSKLGFERRQRPAPSLEDYVRARYGQNGSAPPAEIPADQNGAPATGEQARGHDETPHSAQGARSSEQKDGTNAQHGGEPDETRQRLVAPRSDAPEGHDRAPAGDRTSGPAERAEGGEL